MNREPERMAIDRVDFDNTVADLDVIDHGNGGSSGNGDEEKPPDTPRDDVPTSEASALGPPRHIGMTVIAQDPTVVDERGRAITATVKVPADRIRPPFQTHRFITVNYDPRTGQARRDFRLLQDGTFVDRFGRASHRTLLRDRDFHAQNVLAVAARTLAAFESALGRRVPWAFGNHQLYLVPHAFEDANAVYDEGKQALLFGYIAGGEGDAPIYTCLSHDIIAHETSHALLAGLRPGFAEAGLPDQLAFHEAFADIVALLSVFSVPALVEHALGETKVGGFISARQASPEALRKSVLFGLGEELGPLVHGRRGLPLRHSIELREGAWWQSDREFAAPHLRGEVLVAAVTRTLLLMWSRRLTDLLSSDGVSRKRAAEEGAKSAEHLLRMAIRAIDYCPPLEFEFADFLDAVVTSDQQLVPDDEHNYRGALIDAFGIYGIKRPPIEIIQVSRLPRRPIYERFNFSALQTDPDEVFRFIWENDALLQLDLDYSTAVESIRPATRVGPDGFVVRETVVTYRQALDVTAADLADLSAKKRHDVDEKSALELPAEMSGNTQLRIFGGGSIIFDQFGRPKFHQTKPLLDWQRQSRRLQHLWDESPGEERLGFSSLDAKAERFAALHRAERLAGERW
ncbi:MAG: hypothetical protein M3406_10775 [Chloroflexota bacterium]|nr:hypothetical protein [Chloroflexota bacterium]